MNAYALITGASKGIGKSIAFNLAKRGYNLLLVARSGSALEKLSESIQEQHHVKVSFVALDLSTQDGPSVLAKWATEQAINLQILVNNAGYGLFGDFEELDLGAQLNMIQLNINAVVSLTHLLLPQLRQQQQAYILNVASTASYQAMPGLGIYAASKSFILSFSRALHYELKASNVSVSCVSPGPTETGFASRAGLDDFKDLADKFNMNPDKVAEQAIDAMFSRKNEVITGFLNRISAFGARHLPKTLVERVSAKLYKK